MTHIPESRTLVIFDMDGTLVDAHILDNGSFIEAFQEITGIEMTEALWSGMTEVTSQAVIHQGIGKGPDEDVSMIKDQIRNSFLARLQFGHGEDANAIRAFAGAVNLFTNLKKHPNFAVAIATGCWTETAFFKLGAAGFDLSGIPFASASECYTRADIIRLAAERAGVPIEQAVYVGDGPWDLRATQQLGIPFIGVGRKVDALRRAGAQHTLSSFDEEEFLAVLAEIQKRK